MVIKLLFLVLFIVFPFGQLTRLPLGTPGVNLYLHDLIIGLILLVWLGQYFLKKKKFKRPLLTKPIIGFASVAFFSLLLATFQRQPNEILTGSLYLVRWLAYSGIYFVVYENTWLHGYMVKWLLGAGVISAILGLLQYIFLPDTRFLYYSGWDEHYYRVIGTFLDPGFTGMIYVLVLILLINVYWENFLKKKSLFTIHYSLFTICYLAMALTYSRATYLAYIVGVGVIAWFKKSWKFFTLAFLIMVVTIFLLPRPGGEGVKLERRSSVKARAENYKYGLNIIKDYPLLGVGFNFYRYAQRDYGFLKEDWQTSHAGAGVDSSLLFVLATTGVVGFIAYSWLLYLILMYDVRIEVWSTVLALVSHSFFNNSLFYPWIMLWLWILLATKENKQE